MNGIKIYTLAMLCLMLSSSAQAKMVEFMEDYSAQQAPPEIVALAQKAADIVEFTDNYEIVIPKKAALQINPWNRFIGLAFNPQTKNGFQIINPDWFMKLPENQQLFLLGRNFMIFKNGSTNLAMKAMPFIFFLLSGFIASLSFFMLRKTLFSDKKRWMQIVGGLVISGAINFFIFIPLRAKITYYLAVKHDQKIIAMTIDKIHDKEAAIAALEAVQKGITEDIQKGETFFTPHATLFQKYADALK